jgi:hypothetical protein
LTSKGYRDTTKSMPLLQGYYEKHALAWFVRAARPYIKIHVRMAPSPMPMINVIVTIIDM